MPKQVIMNMKNTGQPLSNMPNAYPVFYIDRMQRAYLILLRAASSATMVTSL